MTLYLLALGVTLAVEVPLVALLFPGRRARMAVACALATTATHVFMHFALPRFLPSPRDVLLVGETVAVGFEAGVYALVSRDLGRSLVASALANSASYGAGLIILAFL